MAIKCFSVNVCKLRDFSSTMCFLRKSLYVKQTDKEISESNSAPLSDLFSMVYVEKNVAENSFSENSSRQCSKDEFV